MSFSVAWPRTEHECIHRQRAVSIACMNLTARLARCRCTNGTQQWKEMLIGRVVPNRVRRNVTIVRKVIATVIPDRICKPLSK